MPDSTQLQQSHERLGFSMCLALAVHAVLILGITFAAEDRNYRAPKLEITLARFQEAKPQEDADYLAQANQSGSGTLEEKKALSTDKRAVVDDPNLQLAEEPAELRQQEVRQQIEKLISSTQQSNAAAPTESSEYKTAQKGRGQKDYQAISQEIATLEARLDIQRQASAHRPRVRRITSVSTKRAVDALYQHNWRTRIEAIGNRNYPSEAKRRGIYGDLRLMVALLPNGEIDRIQVLKSSGHRLLDQAAIRIVHLAAPYDAFPAEMRDQVDVLEIIRTWRFHKDRLTSR